MSADSSPLAGARRPSVACACLATLLAVATASAPRGAQAQQADAASSEALLAEYAGRRARAMERLPDGVLLLHARSSPKDEEAPSFRQDPSFFYFSGLQESPGSILALDGERGESILFVAPAPVSFGQPVVGPNPLANNEVATRLGLTRIEPWEELVDWVRSRVAAGRILYVDTPRRPEMGGTPPGMPAIAGALGLWRQALE